VPCPSSPQASRSPALSSSCKVTGRWSCSPEASPGPAKERSTIKLPPWDTPAWRLSLELRPFYAAVNRVRELEDAPGASPAEIAAARHAVAGAAVQLVRQVDAMRSSKRSEPQCVTSGEPDANSLRPIRTIRRVTCAGFSSRWAGQQAERKTIHSSVTPVAWGPKGFCKSPTPNRNRGVKRNGYPSAAGPSEPSHLISSAPTTAATQPRASRRVSLP